MIFELVVKQEAYDDLHSAYDYYEEQQTGLGDDFLQEVKDKLLHFKISLTFSKS